MMDVVVPPGEETGMKFAPSDAELPRKLGLLSVALLAFFTVCAGPFGIEAAVQAAGPLPVLIGIVLLAILWGMPQALVTGASLCASGVRHMVVPVAAHRCYARHRVVS